MSSTYRWKRWSFETPDALTDDTILTFTDDEVETSVTITTDVIGAEPGALAAYVALQLVELRAAIPKLVIHEEREARAHGLPAYVLEYSAETPGGSPMRQVQVYVAHGEEVLIATATGPKDGGRARALADRLLATIVAAS